MLPEHYTINISKCRLDCHALPGKKKATFARAPEGIAQLVQWARGLSPVCIAFEATGRNHRKVELALHKGNLPAHRYTPSKAAMFGRVMQGPSRQKRCSGCISSGQLYGHAQAGARHRALSATD